MDVNGFLRVRLPQAGLDSLSRLNRASVFPDFFSGLSGRDARNVRLVTVLSA